MVDAGGRLWPVDCDDFVLSRGSGNRGQGLTLDPATGNPGAGVHFTARVAALDSEFAIYVVDDDSADEPYSANVTGWVVQRDGYVLTAGSPLVIEPANGAFYSDDPSEMRAVDSTHALVAYKTEEPTGSDVGHNIALLKRTGLTLTVTDSFLYTFPYDGHLPWTDMSRVPGTNLFIVSFTGTRIYLVEVSGDVMVVTATTTPEATDDLKVTVVDGDGRFFMTFYDDVGDFVILPGQVTSPTTVTWGTRQLFADQASIRDPGGNSDPECKSFGGGAGVVMYRAWYPGIHDAPYGCPDDQDDPGDEQQRAVRVDVSAALVATQYPPMIVNGRTGSDLTAPFAGDERDAGRVAYVYDHVTFAPPNVTDPLEYDDYYAVVTIERDDSNVTGLKGGNHFNTVIGSGDAFWGVDISVYPGTNLAIVAELWGNDPLYFYEDPDGISSHLFVITLEHVCECCPSPLQVGAQRLPSEEMEPYQFFIEYFLGICLDDTGENLYAINFGTSPYGTRIVKYPFPALDSFEIVGDELPNYQAGLAILGDYIYWIDFVGPSFLSFLSRQPLDGSGGVEQLITFNDYLTLGETPDVWGPVVRNGKLWVPYLEFQVNADGDDIRSGLFEINSDFTVVDHNYSDGTTDTSPNLYSYFSIAVATDGAIWLPAEDNSISQVAGFTDGTGIVRYDPDTGTWLTVPGALDVLVAPARNGYVYGNAYDPVDNRVLVSPTGEISEDPCPSMKDEIPYGANFWSADHRIQGFVDIATNERFQVSCCCPPRGQALVVDQWSRTFHPRIATVARPGTQRGTVRIDDGCSGPRGSGLIGSASQRSRRRVR